MPRKRATSTTSNTTTTSGRDVPPSPYHGPQEMGSMYDYLAKIILLGPSGCGKSCLLHRFVKNEWRVLSSQTIGVEFASKIVKIGDPQNATVSRKRGGRGERRKRIKLQLWDTAGTERFRSVSRSYYRGAAGAILVYDVTNQRSFADLNTFLNDARSLGSPQLTVVLAGNKADLVDEPELAVQEQGTTGSSVLDEDVFGSSITSTRTGTGTLGQHSNPGLGTQQRATVSSDGRAVSQSTAANWASQHRIPAAVEVSALSGDNVEEVFNKLARIILTKIELGEIDPDDPMSGIQYGDADFYRYDDGGSSIKSGGLTSDGYGGSTRRRRNKSGWGDVFKLGRPGSSGGGGGKCC
ncbi:GTP-binding protein ypt4 [Pseudocercospora fuligena]|uniref:GTP-binding protein ypt4 n=1 Tax=Pseudocercospora fuligena TaxID=685502 RepID=A0A8H6RUX5_9PEZI|nr:GTP-binding protein ypt4 [Pseudocercospora fuligena]